jgi:hypothetical protein
MLNMRADFLGQDSRVCLDVPGRKKNDFDKR